MSRPLSEAQRDMLLGALRNGGELDFERYIMDSAYADNQMNFALTNTLKSLRRRGLVDINTMLTDAGRWAAMNLWVAADLPAPRSA